MCACPTGGCLMSATPREGEEAISYTGYEKEEMAEGGGGERESVVVEIGLGVVVLVITITIIIELGLGVVVLIITTIIIIELDLDLEPCLWLSLLPRLASLLLPPTALCCFPFLPSAIRSGSWAVPRRLCPRACWPPRSRRAWRGRTTCVRSTT